MPAVSGTSVPDMPVSTASGPGFRPPAPGPGVPDPRGERGRQLPGGALPGHRAVAESLIPPVDWDAEFAANLDNLEALVEAATRG